MNNETIYKIQQKASALWLSSQQLTEDCQIRFKDWEDILTTFEVVTKAYKEVEIIFKEEQQKKDSWKD